MNRIGISVLASVFAAQAALAAGTPAQKCQSGKNQTVGKFTACRFKAEAKLALSGDMTKYDESLAKCDSKYASKWSALEQKAVDAGSSCPSSGDQASIQAFTDTCDDAVAWALAGGSLPPPAPLLGTGQTLCYNTAGSVIACAGTGQDGDSLKGEARSYTDNGDGTITDSETGLVWEKLDDNNINGIHDKDRTFTWDNAFKKVQVLNGNAAGCIAANNPDSCCAGAGTGTCSPFAGQTDWRLPNQFELGSLTDLGRVSPAIDPVFNASCAALCTVTSCSCTVSGSYWSATTYQISPAFAWEVNFIGGVRFVLNKTLNGNVRAVRGGS